MQRGGAHGGLLHLRFEGRIGCPAEPCLSRACEVHESSQATRRPRCRDRQPRQGSAAQRRQNARRTSRSKKKGPRRQTFSNGRYWARTSDPSLSIWCRRSLQFAWVRSNSMVEPKSPLDRTLQRTRTNTDPCHPCHARRRRRARHRSSRNIGGRARDIGIADTLPSRPDRPALGVSTLAHATVERSACRWPVTRSNAPPVSPRSALTHAARGRRIDSP